MGSKSTKVEKQPSFLDVMQETAKLAELNNKAVAKAWFLEQGIDSHKSIESAVGLMIEHFQRISKLGRRKFTLFVQPEAFDTLYNALLGDPQIKGACFATAAIALFDSFRVAHALAIMTEFSNRTGLSLQLGCDKYSGVTGPNCRHEMNGKSGFSVTVQY